MQAVMCKKRLKFNNERILFFNVRNAFGNRFAIIFGLHQSWSLDFNDEEQNCGIYLQAFFIPGTSSDVLTSFFDGLKNWYIFPFGTGVVVFQS